MDYRYIFISFIISNVDCQMVGISVYPESVYENQTVTLTCTYNGTDNEIGVKWFNGTDTFGWIYDTSCVLYSVSGPLYDGSRIVSECNDTGNVYKLNIRATKYDHLNQWCCAFTIATDVLCTKAVNITLRAKTSTSASTTTTTATTITMSTTTTSASATNTETRTASTDKTTSTEKTTDTGMTTQSIKATSSCTVPVLVITGISVSGFLSILLIFIICCCCPCCSLYNCRKEEDTDKNEADLVETNDNEDVNIHITAEVGTQNPAYVLINVPKESSNSAKFKEVQLDDGTLKEPVQSDRLAANPTSTSNKDWEDKPFPNKNEVIESEQL